MSSLFQPLPHALSPASNKKPDVQTYQTATSSSVIIHAPPGYKSRVISSYDGNQFRTFATSTPLTDTDIKNIQEEMDARQKEMQKMFAEQEEFFHEQLRMFQNFHTLY